MMDKRTVKDGARAILVALAVVVIATVFVAAVDAQELECGPTPTETNPNYPSETCWTGDPKYLPPASAVNQSMLDQLYGGVMPFDGKHPFTVMYHATSAKPALQFMAFSPGHNPVPFSCYDPDAGGFYGPTDSILVTECGDHFPNQALYGDGRAPDFGVHFYGEGAHRNRFELAATHAITEHIDKIDLGSGGLYVGISQGAKRGAALMLEEFENPYLALWMNKWFFHIGVPLIEEVTPETRPRAAAQLQGYDPGRLNFTTAAEEGRLTLDYIRTNCSAPDFVQEFPRCNPEIFRLMDEYKIAGFGTVHPCDHTVPCKGVNMPLLNLYPGDGMEHRLDEAVIVFTNATSNRYDYGAEGVGWYNLGISYDRTVLADLFNNNQPVLLHQDTPHGFIRVFRYNQHEDIVDGISQPLTTTFDTTVRNTQQFPLVEGELVVYALADGTTEPQTGVVEVTKNGEVDIPQLTMRDGALYVFYMVPFVSEEIEEPEPEPQPTMVPITYTEQPRHVTPIKLKPSELRPDLPEHQRPQDIDNAAAFQLTPDIGRPWHSTESDLWYRDAFGKTTRLTDCLLDGGIDCAGIEARTSPNGRYIAYSKVMGIDRDDQERFRRPIRAVSGPMTDLWYFDIITAHILVYDKQTGDTHQLTHGDSINRTPEFYADDMIVWVSDVDKEYVPRSTGGGYDYPKPGMKLYRAEFDGKRLSNNTNISKDKVFVLSPEVFQNGDICYATYEGYSPRYFGTPPNHWWIECRDINGENIYVVLGAHGSPLLNTAINILDWADPLNRGEFASQIRGLRGIAQLYPINEDGEAQVSVTNYYRSTCSAMCGAQIAFMMNFGKFEGALKCEDIPGAQQERRCDKPGSGRFFPPSGFIHTPWALDQDGAFKRRKSDGAVTGRIGYAAPWPTEGEEFLATHFRGGCYTHSRPGMQQRKNLGGEPTCLREGRVYSVLDHRNPFDETTSRRIVGDESVHVWDVQASVPYRDLFGVDAPQRTPIKPLAETCTIRVVNARASELFPIQIPYGRFANDSREARTAWQGNAHPAYPALVKHFGVERVAHYKKLPDKDGYASVSAPITAPLQADGSVSLEVPCNEPLMHAGYDENFEDLARSLWLFSLNGDVTCVGCHDGHSEQRHNALFDAFGPVDLWYMTTDAWKIENSTPLED